MKEFYLGRLDDDWTLPAIDDCDFYYWLEICAYNAKQKDKKDKVTIDQVF